MPKKKRPERFRRSNAIVEPWSLRLEPADQKNKTQLCWITLKKMR
jgi:hypothetical protein